VLPTGGFKLKLLNLTEMPDFIEMQQQPALKVGEPDYF